MEKIKDIIDKYPWLLMVVPIIVVVVVALFFLSGKHTSLSNPSGLPSSTVSSTGSTSNNQASNANATATESSGFNMLSFLLRLFGGNTGSSTQNTTATSNATATNGSGSTQSGNTSRQTGVTNGSPNTSTSTAGNQQNNPNNSQTSQSSVGSPSTPIQIIFKTPDGGTQVYTPPATPPVDITWGRYVNAADRYSIDYPTNWQVVKTSYNGHEGVSLYLPGTNPSDPNAQYIGFGLASYYLLPAQNSQDSTYSYPISIGSTNGTMYTQGVLGNGSVAAVFQYEQGSFGLGSNVSDPDFIYVYNYMLQSLTFGPQ